MPRFVTYQNSRAAAANISRLVVDQFPPSRVIHSCYIPWFAELIILPKFSRFAESFCRSLPLCQGFRLAETFCFAEVLRFAEAFHSAGVFHSVEVFRSKKALNFAEVFYFAKVFQFAEALKILRSLPFCQSLPFCWSLLFCRRIRFAENTVVPMFLICQCFQLSLYIWLFVDSSIHYLFRYPSLLAISSVAKFESNLLILLE